MSLGTVPSLMRESDYTYIPILRQEEGPSYGMFCISNCSGHGDCDRGRCICEVQFNGEFCKEHNLSYFVSFATIFFVISAVSFLQLLICIRSEYIKMKQPSIKSVVYPTTQKALYVLVCVGSLLRGVHFVSTYELQRTENAALSTGLICAFYSILLTGSSLIVCFWAEVFHLKNVLWEKPRFLSKSFVAFMVFNIIPYSLLIADYFLNTFNIHTEEKHFLTNVFYGCYAVLLLIVLVFFLFYGVEVYFKLRGAFACGQVVNIDSSQLHQSRFGLISQSCLLMTTVCFLFSEILGQFWKDKVPVLSRNCHDIMFRLVELGVALWFPCVLWNCISPEQLWILNPKKILKTLDVDGRPYKLEDEAVCSSLTPKSEIPTDERVLECWICYDQERTDAGPLIQPCLCKGDMGAVHHDCLRRWLVESAENPNNLKCKVCNQKRALGN